MNKPLADAIAFFDKSLRPTVGIEFERSLAVLLAAARVQVPREPTEAMILAGAWAWERHNHGSPYDAEMPDIWRSMYDASPINALHETGD